MTPWMPGPGSLQGMPVTVGPSHAAALEQLCQALQSADRGAAPAAAALVAGLQSLSSIRAQAGMGGTTAWTGTVADTDRGGSSLALRHGPSGLELAAHIDVSGRAYMGTLAWMTPDDVVNPIGFSVGAGLSGAIVHITGAAGQIDVALGAGSTLPGWTDSPAFGPTAAATAGAAGAMAWGAAMAAAGAMAAAAGAMAAAIGRERSAQAANPVVAPGGRAAVARPEPAPTAVTSGTLLIDDAGSAGGAAHRGARLVWLTGPSPGRQLAVVDQLRFGRGKEQDIDLDGIEPKASRNHAVVSWSGGQLVVNDLGSRNGTRVNGQRVASATALKAGDILAIGALQWRIELDPALSGAAGPSPRCCARCGTALHPLARACGACGAPV